MNARRRRAWIWIGLAAFWGCDAPRIAPVMPPGVPAPKLAPPTAGRGESSAIGETRGSAEPAVSTIISEPTPVGQEKKAASGLVYRTDREGTGAQAKPGQTVTIRYAGRLEDGKKIYDTADHGGVEDVVIGKGRNLQGLDEGIPGMKVGEKRMLNIPGHMAYGTAGQPGIVPPNAIIIFDVELVGVK
jgi:FKBP-type peptidyl-prolyl cis-trans isomerase